MLMKYLMKAADTNTGQPIQENLKKWAGGDSFVSEEHNTHRLVVSHFVPFSLSMPVLLLHQ